MKHLDPLSVFDGKKVRISASLKKLKCFGSRPSEKQIEQHLRNRRSSSTTQRQ